MKVTRSVIDDDGHDHVDDELNGMTSQFKLNLKCLNLQFVFEKCIFLLI